MCNIGQKKSAPIAISPRGMQNILDVLPFIKQVDLSGAELFFDKGNPAGYVERILDEGIKHPHLRFGGLTNGTLINDERARLVVDKFSYLNVSIDTPDPEKYRSIRVGSNIDLVRRNLARIRDKKRTAGLKATDPPVISFSSIIMERTYTDLIPLLDFAREFGAQKIQFLAPWPDSIPESEDVLHDREKVERFLFLKQEAEEKARDAGVVFNDRTVNTVLDNFPDLREGLQQEEKKTFGEYPDHCRVPYEVIFITPAGDVKFCCTSRTVIGNVNLAPIHSIWNSRAAQRMRKRLIKGDYSHDCLANCYTGALLPNFLAWKGWRARYQAFCRRLARPLSRRVAARFGV